MRRRKAEEVEPASWVSTVTGWMIETVITTVLAVTVAAVGIGTWWLIVWLVW